MFCKFRLSDGLYLGGRANSAPTFDPQTEIVVELPQYPDKRTQRYDDAGGVRGATAQEIAALDDARSDQVAAVVADNKEVAATLLLVRSYCNALKAGTYTNKSVADVKADFIAAWKSLP